MKKISILLVLFSFCFGNIIDIGYASWYGLKFHGKITSSGEIYDMNKLTAAHRTLPFGTYVSVTNLKNGKSVMVKINDRGPFIKGRVIDLSYKAALKIGLVSTGTTKVKIEVIDFPNLPDYFWCKMIEQMVNT